MVNKGGENRGRHKARLLTSLTGNTKPRCVLAGAGLAKVEPITRR